MILRTFFIFSFLLPLAQLWAKRTIDDGLVARPGQFPFIVKINELESHKNECTGILISPKIVVTAAHCVSKNKNESHSASSEKNIEIKVSSYFPNPLYEETWKKARSLDGFSLSQLFMDLNERQRMLVWKDIESNYALAESNDLAFLILEKEMMNENEMFPKLNCKKLKEGDDVMIAGYGFNDTSNSDESLNYGYNRLASTNFSGLIYQIDRIENVQMTNLGDSGGPLFLKNDTTFIYGIASSVRKIGPFVSNSMFSSLASNSSKEFLKKLSGSNDTPTELSTLIKECLE